MFLRIWTLSLAFQFVGFACCAPNVGQVVTGKRSKEQIEEAWNKAGWKIQSGWSVVTEEQLVAHWGKELESVAKTQDLKKFNSELVSLDALMEFVACDLDDGIAKAMRPAAQRGLQGGMKEWGHSDSSYRFQRVRQTEFGPAALMRFVGGDGRFNYHLWYLQKNQRGKIMALDMYPIQSGESLATTFRRMTLLSLPNMDASAMGRLIGREAQMIQHRKTLIQFMVSSRSRDAKKVMHLYWELPEQLQRDTFVLMIRLKNARLIGVDEFRETIKDIKRYHPNRAFSELIDLAILMEDEKYDQYIAALKRIENVVGPDAYLLLLHYEVLAKQKKFDDGDRVLQQALKLEPDYENTRWTLVEHYTRQKKFDKAVNVLRRLAKDNEVLEFDFTGIPGYEELQESKLLKELNEELANQASDSDPDDG